MKTGVVLLILCLGVLRNAAGVESGAKPAEFTPYESCSFPDGLRIVQLDPLAPGVTSRPVNTSQGEQQIDLLAGERVMFAYAEADFYADAKIEKLPPDEYPKLKKLLLDNYELLLASAPSNQRNTTLTTINGLETHGLDRGKLEGGVLGFYLLFDDAKQVTTSIYLLNQEPSQRKFKTLAEYATLRDQFLKTYTACIHTGPARQGN